MRKFIQYSSILLLLVIFIWVLYKILQPIPFLFLTGISMAVLFFFLMVLFHPKQYPDDQTVTRYATPYSVIFLLVLFFVSLIVLKDYQHPSGKTPYFTNADHHVIENYGIAFNKSLDFYQDESVTDKGLLTSTGGSFRIKINDSGNPIFQLQNFYTPVFATENSVLLNPLFAQNITKGMQISDRKNKITWAQFSHYDKPEEPVFDMTIIYTSTDSVLLGNLYNVAIPFSDTVIIRKLKLEKGLNLTDILLRDKENLNPIKREIVFRWLNHFSKIYLLTREDADTKTKKLSLFPGQDFFNAGSVSLGGHPITPARSATISFDTLRNFHVGLENSSEPYQIRKQVGSEKYLPEEKLYVLEMMGMNLLPLTSGAQGNTPEGSTEIRFLKNSYAQLGLDEIRSGFLFHDQMKLNGQTRINALLRFDAERTERPLNWEIISLGSASQVLQPNKSFSLQSEDKQIFWLYRFKDLSDNLYNYSHSIWFLAILTILMIAVVTITPGTKVILIETPVFIILYSLFVFRLLLLWRVATFPPLENITKDKFNDLRTLDHCPGLDFLPFSFVILCVMLVSIFIYRYYTKAIWGKLVNILVCWIPKKLRNRLELLTNKSRNQWGLFKNLISRLSKNKYFWLFHFLILAVCCIPLYIKKPEFLIRICGIVIPVISYIYFVRLLLQSGAKFNHQPLSSRSAILQYVFRLLTHWINTPVFFLSAGTLLFIGFWDTGFGILFMLFLLFKSIFFNFAFEKEPKNASWKTILLEPSGNWLYGILGLISLIVLLSNKRIFALLLSVKMGLLIAIMCVTIIIILFLVRKKSLRLIWLFGPVVLLIVLVIPYTNDWIESKMDNKIKNVIYRTSILFEPVEKMLFNFEYNSSNEKKIIETAQNQWFINSYLDKENTEFLSSKLINLQPHFSKGINYSTQTTDAVIPRYIISEFGGRTMLFLLLLFAVPVIMYFMAYKLIENNKLNASSCTGALALILLFTIALFVWLTSTNRFVFFGQDFPFISLGSRISTLLPVLLVGFLLIQRPLQLFEFGRIRKITWLPVVGLFTILSLTIVLSGKSKLLDEENFKVKFDVVENRINNDINKIFGDLQHNAGNKQNNPDPKDLKGNPDLFISKTKNLFDRLFNEKKFIQLYDSCTVYEQSILKKLQANPGIGFDLASPVHLKYDNEQLNLVFNSYFKVETPAYQIEKIWKGDIVQERLSTDAQLQQSKYIPVNQQQAELIVIPGTYFREGTGPLGLLNHISYSPAEDLRSYIYNGKTKLLRDGNTASHVNLIDSADIIFLIDNTGKYLRSLTINTYERPYFAYSFQINGKQRQVYPMGKDLYWIRHYSLANKSNFEKKKEYETNATVTLDYHLTRNVNRYIQSSFKRIRRELPEMSFSVIAADGDGNIRLMADFDMNREILDPNNDKAIAQKEKDQYFIVNNEAERTQWGNLNLLRMKSGPGSSMKPIIAAAIASQLKLEWDQMQYLPFKGFEVDDKKIVVNKYAGLSLGKSGWKIAVGNNNQTSFTRYLENSNNLYHSLLMFLGAYRKEDFKDNQNYSIKRILKLLPDDSLSVFPRIGFSNDPRSYYLPSVKNWPASYPSDPINSELTYFGNSNSIMANGLKSDFDVFCEPSDKQGYRTQKNNFTVTLPDSLMKKAIWSFPEESYFVQHDRTANNLLVNFNKGLRNPTLGGSPYMITPYKMLEMYGRISSMNNLYKLRIDRNKSDSSKAWNYDVTTWGSPDNYKKFLETNIMDGLAKVVRSDGTASALNHGSNLFMGKYYLYAKTGTIDGDNEDDNSKRFALIISKNPLENGVGQGNRFFVVVFTVDNAYKTDAGQDKNWFWAYYRDILNQISESESFKAYMK